MTISNQMMKGLLDGAILGLIAKGETYGYEILEKLKEHQFPEISDGSIYPVLLRLDKRAMYIQPCVNPTTVDLNVSTILFQKVDSRTTTV